MGSIKKLNAIKLNAIRNIGRAVGVLYTCIEILSMIPAAAAQTAAVWVAPGAVLAGLVGRVEVLGGLWILLVTWGALRAGALPRALNYLGLAVSVAGIATALPALAVLGILFRVGEFVWNGWLGIAMLRKSPNAAARKLGEFFVVRFVAVGDVLRGQAGRRRSAGVQTVLSRSRQGDGDHPVSCDT
jgi:hypothetical protein